MLGVHEATGSKPVFLTISEKPPFLLPLSSRSSSVITHTSKYKIVADARKRGDPGNRFIGNIPTANPCSNPSGQAWV